MSLEPSFSIDRFPSYASSKIGASTWCFWTSSRRFCGAYECLQEMNRKCRAQECSLCCSKFLGRRHRHPDQSAVAFLKEVAGLSVENGETNKCICEACNVSIRQALKAMEKGEPYQLRWLKDERVFMLCATL